MIWLNSVSLHRIWQPSVQEKQVVRCTLGGITVSMIRSTRSAAWRISRGFTAVPGCLRDREAICRMISLALFRRAVNLLGAVVGVVRGVGLGQNHAGIPAMGVSRLLNSWAMPPVSVPIS